MVPPFHDDQIEEGIGSRLAQDHERQVSTCDRALPVCLVLLIADRVASPSYPGWCDDGKGGRRLASGDTDGGEVQMMERAQSSMKCHPYFFELATVGEHVPSESRMVFCS